ncbi:BZ3500_MvSof-1268-A1-R1_Chr2-1g04359 [Microbotryum saponariae]|uniref:BZ3500_MvSof-1268-A1-R1_Chr2-1g04359 protein n=1 Tax=Microbotryum saponariae TaxID=289078 RepID=A0A2X0M2J6_9BASI|nr:BZ3500_MvSof-1268-A1-R1_Chr2-1g04359 [Microbotryum saponariae]SCZ91538.1 BZ3501_MvSof-1269-A2-R1_Chr2-1g04015 [Microbotryum saponariae]
MSSKSTQKKMLAQGLQRRALAAAKVNGDKSQSTTSQQGAGPKVPEPVMSDEEDSESDEDDEDAEDEAGAALAFDSEDDEDESDDEDDDEDSEEEKDDITEEGWNKMMELLGDVDPAELGLDVEGDEDDQEEEGDEFIEGEEDDEDEDEDDEEDEEDSDEGEEKLYEDLDDEEVGDDADLVPVERETLRNDAALERILATIKLPTTFFDTLALANPNSSAEIDADNDLERELAFYKQALWAAQEAEKCFNKASLPFFRPADYFAEMIKTDAHMANLRQKLLDEQAGMKASEDARKLRDAKKFGKKVQVERLKEREKEKKEVGKRLDSLKKRRKGGEGFASTEDFDIALEDAIAGPSKKRKVVESERGGRGGRGGKISRRGRDNKFGNPTSSRRPKENNFKADGDGGERGPRGGRGGRGGGRGGRGGGRGGASRGGAKRLGKSRRS